MKSMNKWAAALAACVVLHVHAGESQVRDALTADMRAAFANGDYQAIENRYAAALANSERTPSGVFLAEVIRHQLIPRPPGQSPVPGRDDYWGPIEHKLDDWAAKFPQSSLVAVVQSWVYVEHGFSWRGYGYARTVPPEAFKKVDAYSQRAYEALMAREKVGHKDPYWYVQMLNIARVQGWDRDQFLALIQQATQAFPLNYDIYFSIATRFEPRWGGSAEAIAGVARYAVEQTQKQEGESLYARIYWQVGDAIDVGLTDPSVDWNRIRAGFEDTIKRYPDNWNLNHYARMACEARDEDTTRRLLLRIKGDIEQAAWPDRPTYLRCLQKVGLKREDIQ